MASKKGYTRETGNIENKSKNETKTHRKPKR
jgi:hypothetical protein